MYDQLPLVEFLVFGKQVECECIDNVVEPSIKWPIVSAAVS